LNRNAILAVGNFDSTYRQGEDYELGVRLCSSGRQIGFEPSARVTTMTSNSLRQVLERYWRWNQGLNSKFEVVSHIRFHWYTLKVMMIQDLRARDIPCAMVSLILPYYCAWKTLSRVNKVRRKLLLDS